MTAGGQVFIGATNDGYFRAFCLRTGSVLWGNEPVRWWVVSADDL